MSSEVTTVERAVDTLKARFWHIGKLISGDQTTTQASENKDLVNPPTLDINEIKAHLQTLSKPQQEQKLLSLLDQERAGTVKLPEEIARLVEVYDLKADTERARESREIYTDKISQKFFDQLLTLAQSSGVKDQSSFMREKMDQVKQGVLDYIRSEHTTHSDDQEVATLTTKLIQELINLITAFPPDSTNESINKSEREVNEMKTLWKSVYLHTERRIRDQKLETLFNSWALHLWYALSHLLKWGNASRTSLIEVISIPQLFSCRNLLSFCGWSQKSDRF